MSYDAPPHPAEEGLFSSARWHLVWRQSLFLLSALPLAVTAPVIMICLVSTGAGLLVVGVGFLLLLAAAALARSFGALEIRRLAWAGATPIEPPSWAHLGRGGFWHRIRVVLLDGRQWSYMVHCVLYLFLGTITGSLALTWIAAIVNGATRWFWDRWIPGPPPVLDLLGIRLDVHVADGLLAIFALLTLPWLTRALVAVHDGIARVFLGRFGPEEIDAQIAGLRRSRQSGVAAEGRTLRKLERDLHDGPQQQLLRLQLDLAAAQRKLANDPEGAARLIDEAGRRSAETLSELRHLVRGIAPPILQDRGLAPALAALAERNPIPTTLSANLDPALDIEPAVQQGIYFVVAELLANSVKHSQAKRVAIICRSDRAERLVNLTIVDDGVGGAKLVPDHGLAGIAERIEGLDGRWTIDSPAGGPTTVTLQIPA